MIFFLLRDRTFELKRGTRRGENVTTLAADTIRAALPPYVVGLIKKDCWFCRLNIQTRPSRACTGIRWR